MKAKPIFWNREEESLVVTRAAERILDGSAPTYGSSFSWGKLVFEAQACLPENRHRSENSLSAFAKKNYSAAITKAVEDISAKRIEAQKLLAAERKQKSETEKQPLVVAAPVADSIEGMINSFAKQVAERFEEQLRTTLKASVAGVISTLRSEIPELQPPVESVSVPAVGPVTEVSSARVVEVTPFNHGGKVQVSAKKLSAAVVGGNEKGSQRTTISDGLDEVYDIRFIHSESVQDVIDQVRNCDVVLVRSRFCSQQVRKAVKDKLGERVLICPEGSPIKASEMLMEYYAMH